MREEVAHAKAIEEEERKKCETAEADAKRKAILESGENAAQSGTTLFNYLYAPSDVLRHFYRLQLNLLC